LPEGAVGAGTGSATGERMSSKRKPWQRILLLVGSVGPLGHTPASGTVTVALFGVPLYLLMAQYLDDVPYAVVTVVFCLAAVWVHQVGDGILGVKDSRKLVLDELAGFWVAMIAVPVTWQLVVLGFVFERALDIFKVFPANLVERKVPGGWGVVGDDVVAGLYTLGVLHLACYLVPGLVGVG
jgi:phosphatidylglycerophosphatase A